MEITPDEVLGIMVDGGERLCDYAIEQWIANKYRMGYDARQESIQRWREIKRQVRVLAKRIKEEGVSWE